MPSDDDTKRNVCFPDEKRAIAPRLILYQKSVEDNQLEGQIPQFM